MELYRENTMKLPKFLLLPALTWAQRLRFPTLFKLTAGLFLLTVIVPDPIPLLDEIVLGLGTLMLARWKVLPKPNPGATSGRVYEYTPGKS